MRDTFARNRMLIVQNYLFLYLNTGGGHLAPAKAVSSWIEKKNGKSTSIELYDGFSQVSPLLRNIVEDGYRHSQSKAKWTFELAYAFNKIIPFARLTTWIINLFVYTAIERKILAMQPSKIVLFHFFLIKPTLKAIKKNNLRIPVITVVTDPFTAPPIWFVEPNQHFIVFSNRLKEHMQTRHKIDSSKISVFPFVINPKFAVRIPTQKHLAIRAQLGIDPKSKVILIMGGADGISRGEKLLMEFVHMQVDSEVIIVCGKNKTLFRKANLVRQKHRFSRIHVFGYVNNVNDLISISEVVITKCGASTFMEILLSGKIPMVNTYIWEQEKGNVDFISKNGMGVYEPNTHKIAALAAEVAKNPGIAEAYKNNIKRMTLVNGTPYVSKFIEEFNIAKNESFSNI
jgi:1,2-diacylglycerol 3-beta-galactosyltransferase